MTHNTSTCLRDLETVRTYTKEERKLKHREAHGGPGWKGAEWTGPVGGSRQAVPRDAGGRRAAPQPACLAPHALQLMSERGRQNPNTSGDLTITLETSEDRRSCTCSDVRPGLAALSSGATPQAEGMRPPGTRDRVRPARDIQLTSQPLLWEPGLRVTVQRHGPRRGEGKGWSPQPVLKEPPDSRSAA